MGNAVMESDANKIAPDFIKPLILPKLLEALKIYHQNICGIKSEVNELLSFLFNEDLPHVICKTEHHLNHLELYSFM